MWDLFGPKPREGTEAYRIQEEVRKRKKIAEEKGVKELISQLYFDHLQYFPSWIKQSGKYVPKLIDSAQEETNNEKKVVLISFKGKTYKFEFVEHSFSTPDDYCTHGLLELFAHERKCLAINVSLEHGEYDSKWTPFDIKAFIDGDWIDDFKCLKKAIQENDKLRETEQAEDPKKIEELKNDFGIE